MSTWDEAGTPTVYVCSMSYEFDEDFDPIVVFSTLDRAKAYWDRRYPIDPDVPGERFATGQSHGWWYDKNFPERVVWERWSNVADCWLRIAVLDLDPEPET